MGSHGQAGEGGEGGAEGRGSRVEGGKTFKGWVRPRFVFKVGVPSGSRWQLVAQGLDGFGKNAHDFVRKRDPVLEYAGAEPVVHPLIPTAGLASGTAREVEEPYVVRAA